MGANFSSTTPSAPSGHTNVEFQSDTAGNISANIVTPTTGTVTSVALTVPAEFSVSGSPVTASGTIAITSATQSANQVMAGPTSGAAATPSFRALVAADIPAIAESGVTNLTADLAAKAPTARTISTTAPLTGGGDLSANRTLDISNFTGDSGSGGAKGAVPAPASGDGSAKFLKADGTWAVPSGTFASPTTTKGDLIVRNASVDVRLPAGADGYILTADTTQSEGVKWAPIITSSPIVSPFGALAPSAPPASSSLTWVNQGTATVSDTNGLTLSSPGTGGSLNMSLLMRSLPSTPYTLTIGQNAFVYGSSTSVNGVALRDSGSGKIIVLWHGYSGSGSLFNLYYQKYNDVTTWNSDVTSSISFGSYLPIFLRFTDDGTNVSAYYSIDGTNFMQMGSAVSRTAFLASPDQIGIVAGNTTSNPSRQFVFYWNIS